LYPVFLCCRPSTWFFVCENPHALNPEALGRDRASPCIFLALRLIGQLPKSVSRGVYLDDGSFSSTRGSRPPISKKGGHRAVALKSAGKFLWPAHILILSSVFSGCFSKCLCRPIADSARRWITWGRSDPLKKDLSRSSARSPSLI
jgi:hypothetical protein